jgi:urea carboxylase-associated protein 2/urea carboxylase-associated protein 1
MAPKAALYEEELAGGTHRSFVLRRGTVLRLIDVAGGANVGMLFYNPGNPLERYNMPDTLKCQHTFKLTRGNCLYSDMGRIFCSIVEDTVGWHDTVGGNSTRAGVAARWGHRSYQEARNERTQNGHDSFLVEAGKYGLGRRDLAANVNWFSKVSVADDGTMSFHPDHSRPGDAVALRFEMDTLVLLHTCAHPLDTSPSYPRRPVRYQLFPAAPVAADDYCRNFRPENWRGFENNRIYHLEAAPPGDPPALPRPPEDAEPLHVPTLESPLRAADAVYRHVVPAGEYWLHQVRAGQTLRIVDLEGNQAADTLFYAAADPAERYSAIDTMREQRNVYLSVGTPLRSTSGRIMLEIVADTVGRHDTLGGACATESNTVRYALEKKTMHACRDSWLLAVGERPEVGLTKRDIGHNINFFMNVPVTADGGLRFADGTSGPGKYVEMKAAMDVWAMISNCPQLNNPCNAYNPTPIEVLIFDA